MRPTRCTPMVLLVCLVGCSSYRYELAPVAGPSSENYDGMAMTVVTDRDLVVPAAPARLRLRQVESRCVLMIENPTDAELTLDGQTSAIVDPLGQSRAVAGQLIPPGAFAKLILPPLRDAPPTGPAFQIGVGVWGKLDEPRPARMLDVGRAQDYWEWDGTGRVRVVLGLKQKDQIFRHEFWLTRAKS